MGLDTDKDVSYLELEGIQIERMQKIEGIEDNNVVIRLK